MTDPLGNSRYGVRVRFVEYQHVLFLLPMDMSAIFGLPYDEHIQWFIQDTPADPENQLDGETLVLCADDRNGSVLFQETFLEPYDPQPDSIDNNFYALVMEYVKNVLGYDLGPLVVDIKTPINPLEDINGALLQIEWTTFDE